MKQVKRRYSKFTSRHHIEPRSRGGTDDLENIAKIKVKNHQHYHALFGNKLPFEIVEELVTQYWNGRWDYVTKSQAVYNRGTK